MQIYIFLNTELLSSEKDNTYSEKAVICSLQTIKGKRQRTLNSFTKIDTICDACINNLIFTSFFQTHRTTNWQFRIRLPDCEPYKKAIRFLMYLC